MSKNYPPMVASLQKTDPKLYEQVTGLWDLALSPGELDIKTKLFIAMVLDAYAGSAEGVKAVSGALKGMGVSDAQIAEALRIAYLVAGNDILGTIKGALEG